jgi:hypothetical protein
VGVEDKPPIYPPIGVRAPETTTIESDKTSPLLICVLSLATVCHKFLESLLEP